MYRRSVNERQFRRRVAQVRTRFVALWARDPEQALADLLEDITGLMSDAVRLEAAFGFGLAGQLITKRPAARVHDPAALAGRLAAKPEQASAGQGPRGLDRRFYPVETHG